MRFDEAVILARLPIDLWRHDSRKSPKGLYPMSNTQNENEQSPKLMICLPF